MQIALLEQRKEERELTSNIITHVLNEVYSYGGFPMRLGDIIIHMDEVAKSWDKKNWFKIREAGLLGLFQHHQFKPLSNVEPMTLSEFRNLTGE